MKRYWTITALSVISLNIIGLFAAAGVSAATTPTLSLSSTGGDSVLISVFGGPNASVVFYYNVASASGMRTATLGTTNSSGYFSTTISASSYGVNAGQSTYVIVNGQQSAMQIWPAPTGTPTLSQTSVTLGIGQSATLYSQGSSAPVYMATNSNLSAVSIQTNGTQIAVRGNQTGSATATICYTGTASNCATLNIAVQVGSVLSFSQNNITLVSGGGKTVNVSGGSGSYFISNNSNPAVVSAILSGNTITLSASSFGNANVAVCDTSGNCGTLYITVNNNSTSGSLSFSISNPIIALGQTIAVTVSGGSGYYITGNSNPSIATQTLNGNVVTISGVGNGSDTITVCSTSNGCGSVYVTVASASSTGNVVFGVASPVFAIGQSFNLPLSGGSSYYISSNASSTVAQVNVNGNSLVLYGESVGSDAITVCASGGGCNTLYATVSGTTVPTTTPASASSLLSAIQSVQSQLSQIATLIRSVTNALSQLAASTGINAPAGNSLNDNTSRISTHTFTEFLDIGSQDSEVAALQERLSSRGFYSGPISGFYGHLTESAVKAYQTAHGIEATGYVGPNTRTSLNIGE